jgi:hypothetical protein
VHHAADTGVRVECDQNAAPADALGIVAVGSACVSPGITSISLMLAPRCRHSSDPYASNRTGPNSPVRT